MLLILELVALLLLVLIRSTRAMPAKFPSLDGVLVLGASEVGASVLREPRAFVSGMLRTLAKI